MSTVDSAPGTSAVPVGSRAILSGIDIGRLVGVPIMVGLLLLNCATLAHHLTRDGASWVQRAAEVVGSALSVAFFALLIAAFVRRGRAKATHPSKVAAVAALVATWIPFAIPLGPHGTAGLALLVVADTLLLAGLAFSIWAIRFLDRSFSMVAQARAVVRTGPYAYVRHPLYTGELVALLGTALARPGWWPLAVWVLILSLQVYRARNEEAILAATLPDYADYQRTTPQLIPTALRRRR
jgi:protein-S-isoprenylcysteine O-methyltransferase Ste14